MTAMLLYYLLVAVVFLNRCVFCLIPAGCSESWALSPRTDRRRRDHGFFCERARADKLRPFHTNGSMTAMLLYYLLVVVGFLLSSVFVLVCCRMLGELGLFLLALTVANMTTASNASVPGLPS